MNKQQEKSLSLDVKFKFKDVFVYNVSVATRNIVNDIVMAIGLFVLIFFVYNIATTTEGIDVYISKNITFLLVPILIFVLIPWRVWKITATQMQLPAFAYGVRYEFSRENIVLDLGEESEAISWDLFVNIIETKNDFRLYVNKVSAQIIPKHNLTNEELDILRDIIKNSTTSDKYKLRG